MAYHDPLSRGFVLRLQGLHCGWASGYADLRPRVGDDVIDPKMRGYE